MKRISISYEIDVSLTVDELWPDGDAPTDPTEADVRAVVKKEGGFAQVCHDWDLIPREPRYRVDVFDVPDKKI